MPAIKTRDGTSLYFKDWGIGRPVILIHGWPLNADSWDPISYALSQAGHRVIAYDRRGFGRSDQPAAGYDYNTFSDDLADLMSRCNIEGNIALVGFSMGGGEVARYMSRYAGKNIRSVALISSVVPFMLRTPNNPNGVEQSTFDGMAEAIIEDRPRFMRAFLKEFFGVGFLSSPVSDDMLEASWQMCMQAGLLPTLRAAKAFSTTDFRPDLAAINVPTLIVHGSSDTTVPIDATGRAAAKDIAGAGLVEYEGSPHGIFATDTQRLISDLTEWLDR